MIIPPNMLLLIDSHDLYRLTTGLDEAQACLKDVTASLTYMDLYVYGSLHIDSTIGSHDVMDIDL
jgi:hypothetical protein